ncbi:ABC-three component system middle component 1 [Alteromonas sp. BMJM2]|uniref:ABC-three component system middle component 1 n=1 Tax=Alteromonas sp. BMJM2 TaxID=2954241 RepID=UPI0022B51CA1|nr:ABC-three component system middle component 1 [Alteromonas sp. BMJM2]
MIEFMEELFNIYGYEKIADQKFFFFKSKYIEDYWIVIDGNPEKLDHDAQSKLLYDCKTYCSSNSMEKNTNLLLLWRVDTVERSTLSRLNLLEEDLYFFKKHVLYYTEKEIDDFKNEVHENGIEQLFTKGLLSSEIFNNYKTNRDSWENLLYKIAIKLTFLPIPDGESGDITQLYDSHDFLLSKNEELSKLDTIVSALKNKVLDLPGEQLLELLVTKNEGEQDV